MVVDFDSDPDLDLDCLAPLTSVDMRTACTNQSTVNLSVCATRAVQIDCEAHLDVSLDVQERI